MGRSTVMSKAVVIGNGEPRSWYNPDTKWDDVRTWGCNAIYRDATPDSLVAMDYAMQQEIYDSGYTGKCYFSNWSVVPSEVADMMLMGFDIPDAFIHRSKNKTGQCVISGKDPATVHETVEYMMKMHPSLDMDDLKLKMEKDVGIWITYVNENDNIKDVGNPNLSTGNMALLLACHEQDAEDIYMLGFDLSIYDETVNNIYKGTDNYLPADAKGFNPVNWMNQMSEIFDKYKSKNFHWVDCKIKGTKSWHGSTVQDYHSNVKHLSKEEFCKELLLEDYK